MSGPKWVEIAPGVQGCVHWGADGSQVILLKEIWDTKAAKHWNLDQNWDAYVETVERPEGVYQSNRYPGRKIYTQNFPMIVWESGRRAPGPLMIVVEKRLDRVVSSFVPDNLIGKLGKRLWP